MRDGRRGAPTTRVRTAAPLELPEAALPLPPYALGVWLGDGHSAGARFTTADPEIVMHLEAEGLGDGTACADRHGTVQALLRTLGVLGDKHVPAAYLRASEAQRRALLAGLHRHRRHRHRRPATLQFAVTSERLAARRPRARAQPRATAARSTTQAGAGAHARVRPPASRSTGPTDERRLPARAQAPAAQGAVARTTPAPHRSAVDRRRRRRSPVVPVRCVEVDNADHLYLATRSMVPTHNSTLGLDIARSASVKHGQASCIFSLEMSKTEITMRLLSAEARVPLHHMRAGTMTDDDWARLARRMGEVAEAPLYIDDSPNLTMMEIRAKARRLRQRHDLKLVVIDYLQLMSGNKKAESRQQEVSELSRNLKLLAKELEVPVIAMSQLNRGAEQRTDKKPQLSDLRESGCLPASARRCCGPTPAARSRSASCSPSGATDVPVWSLDDSLRYVRRHLTHVFSTGRTPGLPAARSPPASRSRRPPTTPSSPTTAGARSASSPSASRVAVPAARPGAAAAGRVVRRAGARPRRAHRGRPAGRPASARAAGRPPAEAADPAVPAPAVAARRPPRAAGAGQPPVAARSAPSCSTTSAGCCCASASRSSARTTPRRSPIVEHADGVRFWTEIALAAAQEEPFGRPRPGRHRARRRSGSGSAQALCSASRSPPARCARSPARSATPTWSSRRPTTCCGTPSSRSSRSASRRSTTRPCVGTHNFVADGIAVHNSIEQDADMVILLHREDAYEKESPRAGEADFIVAKHRNGPTSTITVAFQGHYSRFVDMNPG